MRDTGKMIFEKGKGLSNILIKTHIMEISRTVKLMD